jgi:glycosyltransferase involved in cell wall biosynthesis
MNAVIIFLAIKNGEKFLINQLDSIQNQRFHNWKIIVSDDGSTDRSVDIIKFYQNKWGNDKLVYIQGPQQGFCMNFLSMAANPNFKSDYYAFCDQDDVWSSTKIEAALAFAIKNELPDSPFLYGGRTTYTDINLKVIGDSPLYIFPCSFRNALVQNIFGGNTLFFNNATKLLLEKIGPVKAMSHDWWVYLVVSGAGGVVVYDQTSHTFYRQHPGSLIGAGYTFLNRVNRVSMLLRGRFREWSDMHIQLLEKNNEFLTFESRHILENFKILRQSKLTRRFRMLEICGLYRQTFRATLSLYLAILFKKI